MATLAIKGHPKRGNEVIEILEMLGGVNTHNLYGDENYAYYTIDSDKEIKGGIYVFGDEQLCHFTLEEFLEKFPYKVGDKVLYKIYGIYSRIKTMLWNVEKEQVFYRLGSNKLFVATADELKPRKEETMERKYNVEEYLEVWEETEKGLEVVVNNNFELKEDNGKFYIIKKQLQYPKTYKECFNICFGNKHHIVQVLGLDGLGDNKDLFERFIKLKICRDAYWKIAGEEMGLSKPWESDFTNNDEERYGIYTLANKVEKDFCGVGDVNMILVFPTEEMRDAFYENFKDLIERCKELL